MDRVWDRENSRMVMSSLCFFKRPYLVALGEEFPNFRPPTGCVRTFVKNIVPGSCCKTQWIRIPWDVTCTFALFKQASQSASVAPEDFTTLGLHWTHTAHDPTPSSRALVSAPRDRSRPGPAPSPAVSFCPLRPGPAPSPCGLARPRGSLPVMPRARPPRLPGNARFPCIWARRFRRGDGVAGPPAALARAPGLLGLWERPGRGHLRGDDGGLQLCGASRDDSPARLVAWASRDPQSPSALLWPQAHPGHGRWVPSANSWGSTVIQPGVGSPGEDVIIMIVNIYWTLTCAGIAKCFIGMNSLNNSER